MITQKKISVLMPHYNPDGVFLEKAIKSVIDQPYDNLELIVVDDGSTDESYKRLVELAGRDERIVVLRNISNEGVAKSLNKAIEKASGEYFFRMDTDDLCLRNRFVDTVEYLETHKEIDVIGAQCVMFSQGSPWRRKVTHLPASNDEMRATMLFRSPIVHPTVCFRRSSIERLHIRYDDSKRVAAEDYQLWVELALAGCVFGNMNNTAIRYRLHESQVTQVCAEALELSTRSIILSLLNRLGVELSAEEFELYFNFALGKLNTIDDLLASDEIAFRVAAVVPGSFATKEILYDIMANKCFHEALRMSLNGVNGVNTAFAETYSSTILGRKMFLNSMLSVSGIAGSLGLSI